VGLIDAYGQVIGNFLKFAAVAAVITAIVVSAVLTGGMSLVAIGGAAVLGAIGVGIYIAVTGRNKTDGTTAPQTESLSSTPAAAVPSVTAGASPSQSPSLLKGTKVEQESESKLKTSGTPQPSTSGPVESDPPSRLKI
jgi:hypothetical protein